MYFDFPKRRLTKEIKPATIQCFVLKYMIN